MNLFPASPLSTPRLILRQVFEGDWPEILYLRSDDQVNALVKRNLAKDKDDVLDFLDRSNASMEKGELVFWGIVRPLDNKVMGTICIWKIDRTTKRAEMGYDLGTSHQNKGYMSEAARKVLQYAFEELELEFVEAYTQHNNEPSVKMLERLSFALLPALKDEGNPDNVVFELSKATWLETRPVLREEE